MNFELSLRKDKDRSGIGIYEIRFMHLNNRLILWTELKDYSNYYRLHLRIIS